jgi:uncharacterized membrane protein YbhN (UPF0104 family)/membrane-associated phospholipid phosphatase/tRNA A-37 threonylcarbamoyl transferase component Bud32
VSIAKLRDLQRRPRPRHPQQLDPSRISRHPGDIVGLIVALASFLALALFASANTLGTLERDIFRVVNDLPEWLSPPLTAVMQLGALPAAPAAGAIALLFRRWRRARDMVLGGVGAWLLASAAKGLVGRGRPAAFLTDLVIRGNHPGLGFPSGHVAVAAAIAAGLSPYLRRPWRRLLWIGVGLVGLARVFVGAHLPVDIAGGWLLGWAVGSTVRLVFGTPGWTLNAPAALAGLDAAGVRPSSLIPLSEDARGSVPFRVEGVDGARYFAKGLGREQRNADWLFKLWRFLAFRDLEDESPFATTKHQTEHEAYMMMLAERAGVRTPSLVTVAGLGSDTYLLVQQNVDGTTLDLVDPALIGDDLLDGIWSQVATMHRALIAHRDLRLTNVLLDTHAEPWIIDFGFAEAAAGDRPRARDAAELIASMALKVGPQRAVAAALRGVDRVTLERAAGLLQPLALSSATRKSLRSAHGLLPETRIALAAALDTEPPPAERLLRVKPGTIVTLAALGFAVHLLLPQVGELRQTLQAVAHAKPGWLLMGLVGSVITYHGAALSLTGASPVGLAFGRTLAVSLASSFANRIAPASLGRAGLDVRYLERAGATRAAAVSAEFLNSVSGLMVHVLALVATGVAVGRSGLPRVHLPARWILLVVIVAVAVAVGLAFGIARLRRALVHQLKEGAKALVQVARRPARFATLILGAATVTGGYILALVASLHAFGSGTPVLTVAFVYLGGSAIAAAGPTPGQIGTMEAALVAGLIAVGEATGPAVAGVLAFRLLTFWLPIVPGWVAFRRLRHHGSV